jgi:hypothetical protein
MSYTPRPPRWFSSVLNFFFGDDKKIFYQSRAGREGQKSIYGKCRTAFQVSVFFGEIGALNQI